MESLKALQPIFIAIVIFPRHNIYKCEHTLSLSDVMVLMWNGRKLVKRWNNINVVWLSEDKTLSFFFAAKTSGQLAVRFPWWELVWSSVDLRNSVSLLKKNFFLVSWVFSSSWVPPLSWCQNFGSIFFKVEAFSWFPVNKEHIENQLHRSEDSTQSPLSSLLSKFM